MDVAVVGAGASGIMAALQAAQNGASVSLYDHNHSLGRKLLVTGSGRCNLGNRAVASEKYACADQAWMAALLEDFGTADLLAMLGELGIPTYATDDGWYYPLSNAAHAMVDVLADNLRRAGVQLRLGTHVAAISRSAGGFTLLHHRDGQAISEQFERVIVAAGGKAYPSLGSRGELYPALEKLGHRVEPVRPALAPVLVDLGDLKALQGVRLDVAAKLWEGTTLLGESLGNLIITAWGLNGPAVMDLSHLVALHSQAELSLSLDLLAYHEEVFWPLQSRQKAKHASVGSLLSAFFAPKVVDFFLGQAGIPKETGLAALTEPGFQRLLRGLRDLRLRVRGVKGFEHCQASTGGVPVDEVWPECCQSRLVEGLYLCGETLDVVGPCGGYNLHFAFASGALAGRDAALRH